MPSVSPSTGRSSPRWWERWRAMTRSSPPRRNRRTPGPWSAGSAAISGAGSDAEHAQRPAPGRGPAADFFWGPHDRRAVMNEVRTPVALFGASGYTGREAVRLLAAHPAFRLAAAFGGPGRARVPLSTLPPSLRGTTHLRCEAPGAAGETGTVGVALRDRGIGHALLATPEATSIDLAPALLEQGLRVVDLSGAFRLRHAAAYAEWYGGDHGAPRLLGRAAYGLPEWAGDRPRPADLVANPGRSP